MRFLTFSELVPNGYVTTTEDNMLYAVELVMVTNDKSLNDANETLRNISNKIFNKEKILTEKMPGKARKGNDQL